MPDRRQRSSERRVDVQLRRGKQTGLQAAGRLPVQKSAAPHRRREVPGRRQVRRRRS